MDSCLANYKKTAEDWLANMRQHRQELENLVGADYYRRFRTYLMLVSRMISGDLMTLDVVGARASI